MTAPPTPSFEQFAADRLAEQRAELIRAWAERVSTGPRAAPGSGLSGDPPLRALPDVIEPVAEFVRSGVEEAILATPALVELLRAEARRRQRLGQATRDLVREFDVLARVLDGACLEWLGSYPGTPSPDAVVRVAGRLNRAPMLMCEIGVEACCEAADAERAELARQVLEFAEALDHELKTPLGAAEGAALLLENDDVITSSQERRRFAGLIQRNLRRARMVIADVRDLALARASHPQPGRWLPVGQVLAEVLVEVREVAVEAGVRVEVEDPIPDLVVDAARVEIILLNLIQNAVKYADRNRPVRWVRVRFEPVAEDGVWGLHVSDNGLGIASADHPRIFDRLFRAHPDRAEGTGLGLTIVREAVQQLGGRIDFESEPGVGSTFRVFLPGLAPTG